MSHRDDRSDRGKDDQRATSPGPEDVGRGERDGSRGLQRKFVQCVASEANEISTKENKTTIMPEHVVNVLKSLDFEAYVERVSAAAEEMKEEGKEARAERRRRRGCR